MPDRTPIEEMKRLADALEAHPSSPFSPEEQAVVKRVAEFYRRLDALAWFVSWGKWVAIFLIMLATQWGRVVAAWGAWSNGG